MKTFSYLLDFSIAIIILIVAFKQDTVLHIRREPTKIEMFIVKSDIVKISNQNKVLSQKNRMKADSLDLEIQSMKNLIQKK